MSRGLRAIALTTGIGLALGCNARELRRCSGGVHRSDALHASAPEPTPQPVVHEQHCGDVKATWHRDRADDGTDHWDSLVIAVDGHARTWTQDLTDFAPDARTTDLFSPDCQHLLLLTSRTGPYHIIRTDRMAAYLDGAQPDFTLAGERTPLPDGEGFAGAGVFQGGGWLSNTKVAYTWGCCDPPVTTEFELPR